jgi:hypothetical protein
MNAPLQLIEGQLASSKNMIKKKFLLLEVEKMDVRRDDFGNMFCGFYSVCAQQYYEVWEKELEAPALYKVKFEAARLDGVWPRTNNSFVYILRGIRPGRDVVYVGKTEQGGISRPTAHGGDWDYCYILTVNSPKEAIKMNTDVLLTIEDRMRDLLDDDSRYQNTTQKTTKVVLDDRTTAFVDKFLNVSLQLLSLAGFPIGLRGIPNGKVKTDEGVLLSVEEVMGRLSEEETILQERINSIRRGQRVPEVMAKLPDEEDSWGEAQKLTKSLRMVSKRKAIALTIPDEGMTLVYENSKKNSRCAATLYSDASKRCGVRFVLKKGSVICPEEYFSKSFRKSSEYRAYLKAVEEGSIVNGTIVEDIEVYPSQASSWARGCISHGYSDWEIVGEKINLLDFFG